MGPSVQDTVHLGRILGIPVGLHWSVLAILALMVWALATGWCPDRVPDSSPTSRYVAAAGAALAFFGSLLAHEFAHAVVARRHGVAVEGITLWLLGGLARLQADHDDAEVELRVAVVGPLTSLTIAAIALVAWLVLRVTSLDLIGEVALWLALVNAILGVFNMAPAFPLDGGRAHRALVWRRTGDKAAATRRAVRAGRRLGHGLVAIGLVELLLFGLLGGLWLAAIGWFITQAALVEEARVVADLALTGIRVADIMTWDPVTAAEWLSVDRFIDDVVTTSGVSTYPLTDLGGVVTGVVTLRQLASVPVGVRPDTRVREVAMSVDEVAHVRPDEGERHLRPSGPGATRGSNAALLRDLGHYRTLSGCRRLGWWKDPPMADWIHPGQRLSAVAALAIADGASPGPRATAPALELLPHLAASGMRVAVVGGQATDGDGWATLADHQALQRWLSDLAACDGIGPGLVAVIVDGPCDADLEAVPRLRLVRPAPVGQLGDLVDRLREQVHRVDEVPGIDDDPAWVVRLARAGTRMVRVDETLATVADGSFGTRGSLEEDGPECDELVLANGVYTDDRMPTGMPCPLWTRVEMDPVPSPGQRWFDLRTGVLLRRDTSGWSRPPVQSLRFACLARPGTVVLRLEGPLHGAGGPAVRVPATTGSVGGEEGQDRGRAWATTWSGASRVVAAGVQHHTPQQGGGRLDRMAAYTVVSDLVAGRREVRSDVAVAEALGVNRLLVEQRRAWAQRWQDADAGIDGDVDLTRSVRFAVHHLLATIPDRGEASVGARGLSGPAYAGHVFWDADVFVLPALAALRPRAALAMLTYRLARLPQARARAAAQGHEGALFPWESADEGRDVTPHQIVDEDGDRVPVLTGQHALHITADVAWAACRYAAWSGDTTWLAGPGRDLVVEPARFWASRLEIDGDGTAHLRGVIGPDEYHGPVDDDVHTNVLARWNLRAAAALVPGDAGPQARAEQRRWLDLADRIVDGHLPDSGRHEQFAGFDHLEPLVISNIADVPVAADVLLGRDRVASAQVVKQPDVLMAHHMVGDEMPPDSLAGDLDHEGPRLAHGSSLSPAIVAGLLARAGRPDEGEPLFRLAARLDLEDLTGTTAGGLHLATMGGLWQALAGGFAGVEPTTHALIVDPHLPSAWPGLHVTVRHRGVRLRIEARHESVTVTTDAPVMVRFGRDRDPQVVDGRHTHGWRLTTSGAKGRP